MTMTKKNTILILMVIIITITPLVMVKDTEFGGADGAAEEMITEIQPSYEPWFNSIWEPPGGETESLLFALQAAIGAGIIAYYFGYQKGKKQAR
jgi:cobalt/nickel transport protein